MAPTAPENAAFNDVVHVVDIRCVDLSPVTSRFSSLKAIILPLMAAAPPATIGETTIAAHANPLPATKAVAKAILPTFHFLRL